MLTQDIRVVHNSDWVIPLYVTQQKQKDALNQEIVALLNDIMRLKQEVAVSQKDIMMLKHKTELEAKDREIMELKRFLFKIKGKMNTTTSGKDENN